MNTLKLSLSLLILMFSFAQLKAQDETNEKKLYHVLLFQWAADADSEVINEVISLFEGLPAKIDGFEKIEILKLEASSDKFDTIIIQTYTSNEALETYKTHPDHIRITQIAPKQFSGFSKFDYWK
ncbi:Dabb family protein [Fulvivirga lutimaris]|uniref:Dabb family protein n=1 Tax=Fulvivirga lutimaris TaxID=1819566 RepID=UPI0012BC1968|nr:Dabb family protein [Fulvivirga lutimaris]MTI41722.1 Dabb family protein [Fulvivirga lutimaris]